MDHSYVIKKPLLTERTTATMEAANQYAFIVDRRATKDQIRDAVASLYGVRVLKVRTSNQKGETRRLRYGWVKQATVKKAFVRLHEEDRIELF
ncbi:MAG: 50S ribosomal protein L23 [Phycisphaeraceae bacterium]|nr:50S ribosomal protein L23 [Phycisphaerales bacterium]MCB9860276.1 50S ribosomal protein L23 [Phycisphaeraceae bacterium]